MLAVCRQEGDDWRIISVKTSGDTNDVQATFLGNANDARTFIEQSHAGRILTILPSSAYLIRTIRLPQGTPAQLQSALRLEAETRLLGATPDHRLSMTVLDENTDSPVGIVCTWPETVNVSPPPIASSNNAEVHYVPEIAALSAATNGPEEFAASFDPTTGSLAAIVPSPQGLIFRSTREHPGFSVSWSSRIRGMIQETLLAQNIPTDEIEPLADRIVDGMPHSLDESGFQLSLPEHCDAQLTKNLSIPDDVLQRPDADLWRLMFGAFQTLDGKLAPLATLKEHEILEVPSFFDRINSRLSNPRFAVGLVAAAVIVMVLTPLASSGARLLLIKGKVQNLNELEASIQRTESLIEVYRTLDKQAWSMTKLLGDMANCMPENLKIDTFSMTHGEPVSISGNAENNDGVDAAEAVLEFARRLRQTGVFESVEPSFSGPNAAGVREFKLTADVKNQSKKIRFTNDSDYAIVSYSDRKWGPIDEDGYLLDPNSPSQSGRSEAIVADQNEEASEENEEKASTPLSTADATDTSEAGENEAPTRRSEGRSRGSSSNASTRGNPRSRSEGRGEPVALPDPVSAEEASSMNRSEALTKLSEISKARNRPGIDPEAKQKLDDSFKHLMQRVRETAP